MSYMRLFLGIFLFSSFCLLGGIFSCGGSGNVGTDTGNSGTPKSTSGLVVVPDFDASLPDEALQSDSDPTADAEHARAFISGGIEIARDQRNRLEELGSLIEEALSDTGITEITGTSQTVSLGATPFRDDGTDWEAELVLEDDFIRVYFRNTTTDELEGTYLFLTDTDNQAIRGIFAFVNPTLFTSNASDLVENGADPQRLSALAFDFTNTEEALFTMRMDHRSRSLDRFISFHVHHECNLDDNSCLGDFIDITTEEPSRELGTSIRFSWETEGSDDICLAELEYNTTVTVGDPHIYPGVEAAGDDSQSTGSCSLETPVWGEHVYITDDLPFRYGDTNPVGGTALTYYIDGTSKAGWDLLTDSLIDSWLSATAF